MKHHQCQYMINDHLYLITNLIICFIHTLRQFLRQCILFNAEDSRVSQSNTVYRYSHYRILQLSSATQAF